MEKDLKSLKVFSKKINGVIDVLASENKLMPAMANSLWIDSGWNNYGGDSWIDSGWNNYGGDSWIDSGWNNYSGSWVDSGWNNYGGDSWVDSGWNNYGGGGGGCYITTATMKNIGLDDNCKELNMLRVYRDKLVEEDPEFRNIVLEYYKTAPKIVRKISESPDKDEILNKIYSDMVLPVIDLLQNNKIEEAKEKYIKEYNKLKEMYSKEDMC